MTKRYEKPLTAKELANYPDSEIDYSDIPGLDDDFWAKATVRKPKPKPNVSLRLTDEVIQFFKDESPKGYTSQMAAVLSAYVEARQNNLTE